LNWPPGDWGLLNEPGEPISQNRIAAWLHWADEFVLRKTWTFSVCMVLEAALATDEDTCCTALALVKTMFITAESVTLEADIKKMCNVDVWRKNAW
jgi:hypothetical protein